MTDRELLEMAAKAAGINIFDWTPGGHPTTNGSWDGIWNPLTNDGDALRLANALKLSTCHTHGTAMVGYAPWEKGATICSERYVGIEGRDAATRRAITRAAAEIGRAMP